MTDKLSDKIGSLILPHDAVSELQKSFYVHNCGQLLVMVGGHHHVNLHNNKYLIDIFSELLVGYDNDVDSATFFIV